jgi:hypothetical protein
MVRIISYPNEIDMPKIREMIDHINSMKASVAKNTTDVAKYSAIQASMPASLTTNDVNWSISQALTKSGTITASVSDQITQALKDHNLIPSTAAAAARGPAVRKVSGLRRDAPTDLGPKDAGFFFYVSDYAHLALWDGWSWILTDGGGGYYVDSSVDLGPGWVLCDGSTTDYLLQDTPHLEVMGFTTPRDRFRRIRRYFRR